MRFAAALAIVSTSIAACASTSTSTTPSDDGGAQTFGGGPLDASIAARAGRVLDTCAGGPESGCHAIAAGGMHLPDSPPNLVNVPSTERPDMVRVAPFQPELSYMMLKLLGDPRIDGGQMPLGAAPDPEAISTIRAWIEAGAPE